MKTFEVSRFSRVVDRSGRAPHVTLAAEASDLEIRWPPESFMLLGKDNKLHTFRMAETCYDGTPDNEITHWRYTMTTRSDVSVEIFND